MPKPKHMTKPSPLRTPKITAAPFDTALNAAVMACGCADGGRPRAHVG